MYPAPVGTSLPYSPSGSEAKTLILVGLIFQVIFTGFTLLVLLGLSALLGLAIFGVALLILFAGVAVVAIFLLYAAYAWCYERTARGDYEGARTPTLVLGILGIFLGGIIVGVLYLIGYMKLGDAVRERSVIFVQVPMVMVPSVAFPFASPSGYPIGVGGAPSPAGAALQSSGGYATFSTPTAASTPPFCSRCGKPTSFVPQYGRFYCPHCSLYA